MKENNFNFEITNLSIKKNKEIGEKMNGKTFHYHTHILYDIRTSLGREEKTYLEIGAFAGGSASLMMSHDFKTNCISIDLGNPIPKNVAIENVEKFKNPINKYQYFEGSSKDKNIINNVSSIAPNVDILFIDGDHSYNGVISDFENYIDLVNLNGYICFDDYLDKEFSPEVKTGVDFKVKNLDKNKYEIIGCLKYDYLKEFTNFDHNSIYIIKKI